MKKKHIGFVAILFLALFAVLSYASFFYVPQKVEDDIIRHFSGFGFDTFSYKNITRESGKLVFSDITLDEDGFNTIDSLEIKFSPLNFLFFSTYAKNITVRGLSLTTELSDGLDFTFSGWKEDALFIQNFRKLPARVVTLEKGVLDILSNELGGLRVSYEGQLHPGKTDGASIKVRFKSSQKKLSINAKLDAAISDDGKIEITSEADEFSLLYKNIDIKRATANLKFLYDETDKLFSLVAAISTGSLKWGNTPLRDTTITIEKTNEEKTISAIGKTFGEENIDWSSRTAFDGDVKNTETTLIPDNIPELLNFLYRNKKIANLVSFPSFLLNAHKPKLVVKTSQHETTLLDGAFTLTLTEPDIDVSGRFTHDTQKDKIVGEFGIPKTHLPPLEANKDETFFELASKGTFELSPFSLESPMPLNTKWAVTTDLYNAQLDYGPLKIGNIQGQFVYNSSSPEKTANYLPFKLPLKSKTLQNGKIGLNIHDPASSFFQAIDLKIYGGRIKTHFPLFEGSVLNRNNQLNISDISMKRLFTDAGFKDISITGNIAGVIPFQAENGKINVNGAILQSQTSGIVKMPKYMRDALFPGDSKKMKLIRQSLRNYHYEYFEIRFDGDLAERVMMTLNARGLNPDFKNQEPVDLSLQIETQISLLFENLLQ